MSRETRYAAVGHKHRAESRYYMILHRLNHTEERKNRCYQGVKMEMSKDEFVEWFMSHDFPGASVDRIDKTKNYSADNVQLVTLAENIRKDKVKAKAGLCQCYKCKEVKPLDLFATDKRRKNGHSTICKACDSKRRWPSKEESTGR